MLIKDFRILFSFYIQRSTTTFMIHLLLSLANIVLKISCWNSLSEFFDWLIGEGFDFKAAAKIVHLLFLHILSLKRNVPFGFFLSLSSGYNIQKHTSLNIGNDKR